jgi:membrane protease YdiL (CAAX protease family)
VGIQWYLFVLLYPAAIWLVARTIDAVFGLAYELAFMPILTYFGPEQAIMVPVALVFAFPNTLGEELGWRGFALPRLQARYSALVSSIILGLFWGSWHIPLWIAFGQTGLPLLIDVVSMVQLAILYTWVYNSTGGSLLLVWLFHFAMTVTQYFLPRIPTLTDDVLSWSIAVLVVIIAGARHLSRHSSRQEV